MENRKDAPVEDPVTVRTAISGGEASRASPSGLKERTSAEEKAPNWAVPTANTAPMEGDTTMSWMARPRE